jgi:uncharacterized protein YndB with AHSA1/START domain
VDGYVLTVERTIPAPAEAIFELLADPGKHALVDGSGMLEEERPDAPSRLSLGATFGMSMKVAFVGYTTTNTVVEFEEGKRIAWRTGPAGSMARFLAGRIWRYELEAADDGTLVRESWDISTDHQRALLKLGGIYSGKTRRDMERTLARLAELVGGAATR